MSYEIQEDIPYHTKLMIDNYVQNRWHPGHFVEAVLANDLKAACASADFLNSNAIKKIVEYVVMNIPSKSHGSYEAVAEWLENKEQLKNE